MIDVSCKVRVVALNDKDTNSYHSMYLYINSHVSDPGLVVMQFDGIAEFPEGITVTVRAKDLQLAIDNASNTKRF